MIISHPVIYNTEGSIIPISQTSFRKQDLANGTVSSHLFSKKHISVVVNGYSNQNFIFVNESSPGCFYLSLNCGNFHLSKKETCLEAKVLYKGEVRKSFQFKVKYPTVDASFQLKPNLCSVKEWISKIDLGTISVKPGPQNVGSEWWQYNEQLYLFIKTPNNIVCYDRAVAMKRIGAYYKFLLQPKQQQTFRFEYLGGDRSCKETEQLTIEYYIGSQQTPTWINAAQSTILIRPLVQGISVHPIIKKSVVNMIDKESPVIMDCHVNESNNLGFKLNGFKVSTSSSILEIAQSKEIQGELDFVAKLNLSKISVYPISETPLRVNVGANDVGSKFINLSYGSIMQSKQDYIRIDIPKDTFEISAQGGGEIYPETLQSEGFTIKLIQRKLPKVKIQDLSVSLMESNDLVFDNGSKLLKIQEISPGTVGHELKIRSIQSLNPSHKNIKTVLRVSINNSVFYQDIQISIQLKQKKYYLPKIEVKPICQENETIQSTSVLFTLSIENPLPIENPNSGAKYDVSKIQPVNGYILNPLKSVDFLKSGESIEYNVLCNQIITTEDGRQELPPFELYYGTKSLYKRDVKLIVRKIIRKHFDLNGLKLKNRIVSISYPGVSDKPIPVASIKYEYKQFEGVQTSSECIYVPLPDENFKVRIKTPGFTFGDTPEALMPIKELTLYIESHLFKEDNISRLEEMVCEIEYNSQYRSSETQLFKVQLMPIEVLPKMNVAFGNLLLFPSNNISVIHVPIEEVRYFDTDLKSKKLKSLGSFLISNKQKINTPPIEGILGLDIIGVSINDENIKLKESFPIGVNKTRSKLFSNQSQKVDLLLSWSILGEILTKQNFKGNISNYTVHLKITTSGKEQFVDLSGVLISKRNDNIGWYSLDLGTTGIVVAKKEGSKISLIEINGKTDSTYLEQDPKILSSLIGINVNGESDSVGTISLIRTKRQNGASEEILPAAKFVVDQNEIPYSTSYKARYKGYKYFENDDIAKCILPDTLVVSLYRHILSKLDARGINRLTLTYPNTYTRAQVKKIKELIKKEYPDLDGYINAVPESDAALAHYLNLRSRRNTLPENSENIIIFDMGAGTLDICYVKFKADAENRTGVAKIERKIGIPVAGDYLNYAIYLALKDHVSAEVFENGNSRRQILEEQKTLPKFGKSEVLDLTDADINTQQLIDSESVQNYLEYCGRRVFEVLFGKKDWEKDVDTIVFTGRASRFQPLRDYISKSFEMAELAQELSNVIDDNRSDHQYVQPLIDTETISDSELKQCVAIGAIEYTQAFSPENEANEFKIVSRNQYLNLYLVYETYGIGMNRIIQCDKIIDPMNYDWESIPVVNGTKTQVLDGETMISVHPQGDDIILVQSLLDEKDIIRIYEEKRNGTFNMNLIQDDCFINEVYRIPVYELGDNLRNLTVSLRVSKDNDLRIIINSDIYTGEKIRENIEENKYYNVNRILLTFDLKS